MTYFARSPVTAFAPQMQIAAGSFVIPTGSISYASNIQIVPQAMTQVAQGTPSGAGIYSVLPMGSKVPVFINPNGTPGASTGTTNTVAIPKGMALNFSSALGSEYCLDLTGFPAAIASATADITCVNGRNVAIARSAAVSYIDNVNKLVYVQVVNYSTGALTTAVAGDIISWQVFFSDSFVA